MPKSYAQSHQDTTTLALSKTRHAIGQMVRFAAGSIGIRIGNGPACAWRRMASRMRGNSLSPAASWLAATNQQGGLVQYPALKIVRQHGGDLEPRALRAAARAAWWLSAPKRDPSTSASISVPRKTSRRQHEPGA